MSVDMKLLEQVISILAPQGMREQIHQDFLGMQSQLGLGIYHSIDAMKSVWGYDGFNPEGKEKFLFTQGILVGIVFAKASEEEAFKTMCHDMIEKYKRFQGENVTDFMAARIKRGI